MNCWWPGTNPFACYSLNPSSRERVLSPASLVPRLKNSAYLSRRTLPDARSKEKLEEQLELLRCDYEVRWTARSSEVRPGDSDSGDSGRAGHIALDAQGDIREHVNIRINIGGYRVIAFGSARTEATETSFQMPLAA